MVLRATIFFAILINLQFSFSLEVENFSDVTQPLSTDDHKILQACHNEDYRTYLRCLKRHKRHHEISGSGKSCLDDCTANNCTSSKCLHDCYTRCKKKITETYSKVTETEYDCSGGNCNDGGHSIVPNITTNLNINIDLNKTDCKNNNNNNGNNGNSTNRSPGTGPLTMPGHLPETENNNSSKITINNIITNLQHGSEKSNCICPGCNCFPWPLLPQITIGFGPGPMGDSCCYPQPCTCYQESQKNFDCSSCGNPFLRYQCETYCYNLKEPVKNTTAAKGPSSRN